MRNIGTLQRGTEVTLLAYGDRHIRRRVWEDYGDGILICREEEYQRALSQNEEATCSGFSKMYVLEVHDTQIAEGA